MGVTKKSHNAGNQNPSVETQTIQHLGTYHISLKELCHRVFWEEELNFSKPSFQIRFNLFHPQPSLFLFALESPLCCFSLVSLHFNHNLGHRWNDSKYRDVAPLRGQTYKATHRLQYVDNQSHCLIRIISYVFLSTPRFRGVYNHYWPVGTCARAFQVSASLLP